MVNENSVSVDLAEVYPNYEYLSVLKLSSDVTKPGDVVRVFDLSKRQKNMPEPAYVRQLDSDDLFSAKEQFLEAKKRVDGGEFGFLDPNTPGYIRAILEAYCKEAVELWTIDVKMNEAKGIINTYRYSGKKPKVNS